jgi:hypothetical protein
VDTSDQHLVHLPDCYCTELPKACNYEWDLWLGASSVSSGPAPLGVICYYQHLFCRTHIILPRTPGGPPSTSPTLVVATAGPTNSIAQGGHHRRLQLRWWPLLDLLIAPPRGSTIDVSNFGGGRYRTCHQHPQVARHRRLQLWWWPLPDLPTAPPGEHAIDICNSGGGRCWTCRQHP